MGSLAAAMGDEEGERRIPRGKEREAAIEIDTRLNRFKPIFDSA